MYVRIKAFCLLHRYQVLSCCKKRLCTWCLGSQLPPTTPTPSKPKRQKTKDKEEDEDENVFEEDCDYPNEEDSDYNDSDNEFED